MEIYELLARYNRALNARLREIFDSHPGAASGAILKQLNHLAVMDLIWIARLGGSPDARSESSMEATLFRSVETWWATRDDLDSRIDTLVSYAATNPGLAERAIEFVTKADGVNAVCRWDHALFHLFNHHSLHRGEILRLLSDQGITFGNSDLLPFLIDSA